MQRIGSLQACKGGAEGILVFVRLHFIIRTTPCLPAPCFPTDLFASTVATCQQLPESSNGTVSIPQAHQSMPKIPSASAPAVFVDSVWSVSPVLSRTCALLATMLQQWARRVSSTYSREISTPGPCTRVHSRVICMRRAEVVEALPASLLIPILIFFSELVVFAFRGNIIVNSAIMVFCVLWYLTLAPLVFHDCPYRTPLSTPLWFCAQVIQLFAFLTTHHTGMANVFFQ